MLPKLGLLIPGTTYGLLSLGRIAFTPVMIWLLTFPGRGASALVAGLFFLACLSDWLDGYLARRHGTTSNLGRFLDPLADKILIVSGFIMLAALRDSWSWRKAALYSTAVYIRTLVVLHLLCSVLIDSKSV